VKVRASVKKFVEIAKLLKEMVLLELFVLMEGINKDKVDFLYFNFYRAIIRHLTLEYYSWEYLNGTYCRYKCTRP
jgi:hypothetical protein